MLGLPALGHLAADGLAAVTALAALCGPGFGVVTVCGATAVATLVEPARRGRAIGALGLASAAPQFVLVPIAPWLAERAGFGLVFVLAVLPALAIPLAWPIARAVGDRDRSPAGGSGYGKATAASYSVAFGVLALAVGFTGACWALPMLARRGRLVAAGSPTPTSSRTARRRAHPRTGTWPADARPVPGRPSQRVSCL